MSMDIGARRADTPGCAGVIHLNNAGASLPPRLVVDAVVDYLREEARVGGYEMAAARSDEIEGVYASVAAIVGANRHEIALLDNATRAWDMAFYSMRLREGDRILTTSSEYAANFIAYLQAAGRTGALIEVVPDTPSGEIDVDALEAMIDERTRLISMNHMPTNGGLVNPAAEVGAVARSAGVPFLLDACQTVGQMPIDVDEIGCDMLSATSRKFVRGPRGVGFLYVRDVMIEELDPITLDLHSATWVASDRYQVRRDARRFETWEASPALRLGLGSATDYAMEVGLDAIWDRVQRLATTLRSMLGEVPGVTVRDVGAVQGAIVTFDVAGTPPERVKEILHEHGVNVSVVSRSAARIDMERRGLDALVRASVHYYNTDEELTVVRDLVGEIATGSAPTVS